MKVRIATRKSPLALAQTAWVTRELQRHHPDVEVSELHIVTLGDRIQDRPLSEVGGKGLFVTEIEEAIREGRADLAVHSMKDVPAVLAEGLIIGCVPVREDARDVLVTADGVGLDDLEAFSKVGTSSLRRAAQLRQRRNDIICEPIRGNVETRLRKLDEGQFRAIVLALAGLRRLGLAGRPHRALSVEESVPAVGQGALGLEVRADDRAMQQLLAPLEHAETRIAVAAERAYLAKLEGGCQLPIGGHAAFSHGGTRLHMDGLVGTPDGEQVILAGNDEHVGDRPYAERLEIAVKLGEELADRMLAKGAAEMIEQARVLARQRGWKG